jgi:tetratricopeptide (TPR) repeat protein
MVSRSTVFPQTDRTRPVPDLRLQEQSDRRATQGGELELARRMIATDSYISAANLLEDLYSRQPDSREIVDLLLLCYTQLKAYHKSEILLKRRLESQPFDFQYHDRLLEVYLKTGADSAVGGQIDNMLGRFPGNPDIYAVIVRRLVEFGRYEKAMSMVKQGRNEFRRVGLFALEAASILEIKGKYYEAVMEYLHAVTSDTLRIAEIDRRMGLLIGYPRAPSEVTRALKDILDSVPDNKFALQMLQEAYVKNDQFAEAFDVTVRLDSLADSQGREMFKYMRQCRERKLYEQVVKVGDYIDKRTPEGRSFADYRFYRAEALAGLGQYNEAIADYRYIVENYPGSHDRAEALLLIGNVYRYDLKDYDSARIHYDSVVFYYQLQPSNAMARLEIARLYLVEGLPDSAEAAFAEIESRASSTDLKELVLFNRAMIQFYKKDFEKADLGFRALIEAFPRGFYVNDAIISTLIIRESQSGYSEALGLYAEALYFGARLMADSTAARYADIISMGETPLVGLAMYRLAGQYADQGDSAAALGIIDRMETEYPGDYFFPYGLKLRGDIYARVEGKLEEAMQIYKTLLKDYGSYPFTGEIRQYLQQKQVYDETS